MALLAILPVVVVELLRLLVPETALPIFVPTIEAIAAVTAVMIAFHTLPKNPGFLLSAVIVGTTHDSYIHSVFDSWQCISLEIGIIQST